MHCSACTNAALDRAVCGAKAVYTCICPVQLCHFGGLFTSVAACKGPDASSASEL